MLRQIAKRDERAAGIIGEVFAQHKRDRTEPTVGELTDLLKTVLTPYRLRQFILDGLDESPEEVQVELLEVAVAVEASVLIFSRPLDMLSSGLVAAEFIEISADEQDIELLVAYRISRFNKLRKLVEKYDMRKEITSTIVRKASGM